MVWIIELSISFTRVYEISEIEDCRAYSQVAEPRLEADPS